MIVSCGEALIDMLPGVTPSGEQAFVPVPGGAAFNTAITVGRLGAPSAFFCAISRDLFGDQLRDALAASAVDTSLCIASDLASTLAFVTLVDGHAKYTFFDENSALRMLHRDQLPVFPGAVSTLHFGTISLIPEPCASAFEALMRRHQARQVISLDPNIRTGFIVDEPGYRARLARMIAMSDIIKVSDEDFAWLAPGRAFEQVAAEWIAQGAALVIETRGARGALAVTAHERLEVAAPPATVVDTVGAGDSFDGALLASLHADGLLDKAALHDSIGAPLERALRLAARVAAVTVGRAGANPPWASELADQD